MLKKVLAVSCFMFVAFLTSAQSPGGGSVIIAYGDRQPEEIPRPESAGGGSTINCKANPNKVCVQVNTVSGNSGSGTAILFTDGKEVERCEVGSFEVIKLEGKTEVVLVLKK